jgi:type IV pilus assembly protein PilA
MTSRRAFTLIELLIVVVIIGILAALAVPKFSYTKGHAYTARMKSDLRNLAVAQEGYFYQNGVYATSAAVLAPSFVPSAGNTLTVVTASAAGWSATATSSNTPITCALFYGVAAVAPATADGVIACQ